MEMRQEDERDNGRAILDKLKALRFHEGDENEFWKGMLFGAAALCKSPAAVFIKKEDDQWRLCQEFYLNEKVSEEKEYFLTVALNLAERASENGFAFEKLDVAVPRLSLPVALVIKIDVGKNGSRAVLFLVADRANMQQFNDVVVRTQLINDIPLHYYNRRQQSLSQGGNGSSRLFAGILEILAKVIEKKRYLLAAMTLVNEIASRFECSQVSMGWKKGTYIKTVAISNVESFKRTSEAVRILEGLYEEAYEQNQTVAYPAIDGHFTVVRSHMNYLKRAVLNQVITIPVSLENTVIAVVTLERKEEPLTDSEIDAIELILKQTAHWLDTLYRSDRWVGSRAVLFCHEKICSLLGFEHSLLKATAILLSAALLYSIIGVWDYRVEGSAALKTDSVGYISAPYDGLIAEVMVQEGNEIAQGDPLLKIDTRELILKEAQESAKMISFAREIEKNRAKEAFADMQIAQSKLNETKAELEKVRYYIERADMKAQFDGILVEGDKQKLLGSPVSKGDILLKIAKIDAIYASIKVSEKDIDLIKEGAKGELILVSKPEDVFDITLEKIIPMAEVDQREGNVFVVKAEIENNMQPWWRPGMSGIAKIDAGEKKIIWILTHRLVDFLRMFFWW
ncbi:MAG: efflux RND transporter periplasmic adaptor subunit [Syntrophales bacterium]|nr:efflux RND transporter periplasmic adaptor subunit [Syntrophales bacterium]